MTDLTAKQATIYAAIHHAALTGAQCPSRETLGKLIGTSKSMGGKMVHALAAKGVIRVTSTHNSSVIFVVALGKSASSERLNGANLKRHRAAMVKREQRAKHALKQSRVDPPEVRGCRRLLAAQLRTGAHWINDPAKLASAMREARMAS